MNLNAVFNQEPTAKKVYQDFLKILMKRINRQDQVPRGRQGAGRIRLPSASRHRQQPDRDERCRGQLPAHHARRHPQTCRQGMATRTCKGRSTRRTASASRCRLRHGDASLRGWLSTRAKLRGGKWFTFANTHLEAFDDHAIAQHPARETGQRSSPKRWPRSRVPADRGRRFQLQTSGIGARRRAGVRVRCAKAGFKDIGTTTPMRLLHRDVRRPADRRLHRRVRPPRRPDLHHHPKKVKKIRTCSRRPGAVLRVLALRPRRGRGQVPAQIVTAGSAARRWSPAASRTHSMRARDDQCRACQCQRHPARQRVQVAQSWAVAAIPRQPASLERPVPAGDRTQEQGTRLRRASRSGSVPVTPSTTVRPRSSARWAVGRRLRERRGSKSAVRRNGTGSAPPAAKSRQDEGRDLEERHLGRSAAGTPSGRTMLRTTRAGCSLRNENANRPTPATPKNHRASGGAAPMSHTLHNTPTATAARAMPQRASRNSSVVPATATTTVMRWRSAPAARAGQARIRKRPADPGRGAVPQDVLQQQNESRATETTTTAPVGGVIVEQGHRQARRRSGLSPAVTRTGSRSVLKGTPPGPPPAPGTRCRTTWW